MIHFGFEGVVPRPHLPTSSDEAHKGTSTGNHFVFHFVSALQYYFDFTPPRTGKDIILDNTTYKCMTCNLEVFSPGGMLPNNGVVNDWLLFRHEDAPSEKGESCHTPDK